MARFVEVEKPDGAPFWVNADLVQYLRVFDGVTRMVFRALAGGYDEVQVKGSIEDALGRLQPPQVRGGAVFEVLRAAGAPPAPKRRAARPKKA